MHSLSSPAAPNPLALTQLRHHTRNTLHRVLLEVQEQAAFCGGERGRRLLDAVAARIAHSVAIADALFGVTQAEAPFAERLRAMCRSTVALLADTEQVLTTQIMVAAPCPPALEIVVLRAAQEFVANAVKHGMHMRLVGRIVVRLGADEQCGFILTVRDDGWGPHPTERAGGEGLAIVRDHAALFHGALSVTREGGETVARLELPGSQPG